MKLLIIMLILVTTAFVGANINEKNDNPVETIEVYTDIISTVLIDYLKTYPTTIVDGIEIGNVDGYNFTLIDGVYSVSNVITNEFAHSHLQHSHCHPSPASHIWGYVPNGPSCQHWGWGGGYGSAGGVITCHYIPQCE